MHQHPARDTARSATDAAGRRARYRAAGGSLAAAVLAGLAAEPGATTVAVIAAHAGISVTVVRQAGYAREGQDRHPRRGHSCRALTSTGHGQPDGCAFDADMRALESTVSINSAMSGAGST